jgi:hypothetical protein
LQLDLDADIQRLRQRIWRKVTGRVEASEVFASASGNASVSASAELLLLRHFRLPDESLDLALLMGMVDGGSGLGLSGDGGSQAGATGDVGGSVVDDGWSRLNRSLTVTLAWLESAERLPFASKAHLDLALAPPPLLVRLSGIPAFHRLLAALLHAGRVERLPPPLTTESVPFSSSNQRAAASESPSVYCFCRLPDDGALMVECEVSRRTEGYGPEASSHFWVISMRVVARWTEKRRCYVNRTLEMPVVLLSSFFPHSLCRVFFLLDSFCSAVRSGFTSAVWVSHRPC